MRKRHDTGWTRKKQLLLWKILYHWVIYKRKSDPTEEGLDEIVDTGNLCPPGAGVHVSRFWCRYYHDT